MLFRSAVAIAHAVAVGEPRQPVSLVVARRRRRRVAQRLGDSLAVGVAVGDSVAVGIRLAPRRCGVGLWLHVAETVGVVVGERFAGVCICNAQRQHKCDCSIGFDCSHAVAHGHPLAGRQRVDNGDADGLIIVVGDRGQPLSSGNAHARRQCLGSGGIHDLAVHRGHGDDDGDCVAVDWRKRIVVGGLHGITVRSGHRDDDGHGVAIDGRERVDVGGCHGLAVHRGHGDDDGDCVAVDRCERIVVSGCH